MPAERTRATQWVLIVSGDPALRERLYDVLTQHGYAAKTVANGRLGLEMLKRGSPQLIMANSSANDCAGWGFPDQIRRFDADVPIILVAHPGEEPPDPRTARDIQAYLSTDVSDAALLDAVKRWLRHAHATASLAPIDYPGTILAIDDEPEILQALEEFLRPRRCEVVTACSGEEGLEQIKRSQPTLVLLDLRMPGMDGLLALRKIKELRPHLPVVIMTAEEDTHVMGQAFALGAFEYVVKPCDFKMLQSLLSRMKRFVNEAGP
jgi:DNA-binding response OmpR family regulator